MKNNVTKGLDYMSAHILLLSALIFAICFILCIVFIFASPSQQLGDTVLISMVITFITGLISIFIRIAYSDQFKLNTERSWD